MCHNYNNDLLLLVSTVISTVKDLHPMTCL